jgi:hypothetical protein
VANDKVYIHEFIDIIGHNRANYMHHMTANWSPMAQLARRQLCYGVWGTVGTTRRWPEVVNLWEEEGFDGLARSFRHEFNHPTLQDPALSEWWHRAAGFRRSGVDRVLVPTTWSRTIEQLCLDGVSGEAYAHELVSLPSGAAWSFLEAAGEQGRSALETFGWDLIGAWSTAMCGEREAILLWALPSWEAWAECEKAQRLDPGLMAWNSRQRQAGAVVERFLLVDAPLSPLRTGRQPRPEDRDTYTLPD